MAVAALLLIAIAAVIIARIEASGPVAPRKDPVTRTPLPRGQRASPGRRSRSPAALMSVRRLAAYGLPVYCGGRSGRMVALTFDDGPGPYTKLAINKLREHHLRATFFLVGKELTVYPGRARREKAIATVGDHTLTHPFLPALSRVAMVHEIAAARKLIARAAGQRVVLFRPPYGGHNQAIDREVKALGMLQVLWNVDSADSLGANYAGIERNVIAGLHPGSIILMHENRGQTIRALPTIFAALARARFRAVTVPELLAADPPSIAQLRAGQRGCAVRRLSGTGH